MQNLNVGIHLDKTSNLEVQELNFGISFEKRLILDVQDIGILFGRKEMLELNVGICFQELKG